MPAKSTAPRGKKAAPAKPVNLETSVRGPVNRDVSHKRTYMPHERDERAETPAAFPNPDIQQAYTDLENRQADTDLRGTAVENFNRAPAKSRKRP